MMKELKLLLKPVSADCNMRCAYCFYMDEAAHREIPSYGKMTQETVRTVVQKALKSADSCVFGFQGGEPTLAGLDFYENFTDIVREMANQTTNQTATHTANRTTSQTAHTDSPAHPGKQPGKQISYTIQTNGLILDDKWADFFKRENFLVGISLDGTRELHDMNRRDAAGKGTYSRVLKNARMLLAKGVPVNILCVLTKQNARKIRTIYQTLKKQGFYWQQYIPCLEPLETGGCSSAYSLSAQEYGEALKTLFDLWFGDRLTDTPVYVRELDNWLHVLRGGQPEACAMYGRCTMQNVVEANGNVYPCDFYALDEFCMGNIREYDFEELSEIAADAANSPFFKDRDIRGEDCASCRWYPLCRGGCRRDCTSDCQSDNDGACMYDCRASEGRAVNRWCTSYQDFFQYAISRLEYLAARD